VQSIELVEVGPRDGLQNESLIVSTADKVALIERAVAAGIRRIEVASFANPRRVPQMADAEAVIAALPDWSDVTSIGLVMNIRGAERALATKVGQLGAVCITTDSFAMRNQGQTSAQSMQVAQHILALAQEAGRSAQVTIGAAFGCPFEGHVSSDRVVAMAVELAKAGPCEIALADTIGVAVPTEVTALVGRVRDAVPGMPIRCHFHNTRNTGLANVWAAVEAGATTIDASLGGLGGCPFAPGAAGNVPTEDVQYLLERSGVATGVQLDRLIAANRWFTDVMGKPLPSMVSRAGPFPAAQQRD
jgi:hydroxymethylglutaryl-CoA lyase